MLSNAYFLAKFRFDTAEKEPAKNLLIFPILLTLIPNPSRSAGIGAGSALTLLVGMMAYYTCALILKWGARPRSPYHAR